MDKIRSTMLTLIMMAALAQFIAVFSGDDENSGGVGFICGLCGALCMLNAYRSIVGFMQ